MGIGAYFAASQEPDIQAYAVAVAAVATSLSLRRWLGYGARPVLSGCGLLLLGFLVAGMQANLRASPVLGFRYYGPITGRIVTIDRSASEAVRLTLDQVVLARMAPNRTPEKVRVSLHGDQGFITPQPGMTVMLTGHLSPPSGPVEPGGFDFRRKAWFDGLGAVGYTRNPVLLWAEPLAGPSLWIDKMRYRISQAVLARLEGEAGAFAAAILTGDRSAMGPETLDALRATNLAHLLAISGLHMGLLTGFVFSALRLALALVPYVALRYPTKKMAAVGALLAGGFYLALSGGNVATERAFIMVAMMLAAILVDRRALTLRAVALAAMIVLTLHPEELLGPGFQMSFAATTALVAVFGWLQGRTGWMPKWLRPIAAVFISSLVAGLATAPFAAAHFNQVSHFGLIANLLSVPIMAAVVMPAAVVAACLWPFGGAQLGLWAMQVGVAWILYVAQEIAGWPGALSHVQSPQWTVLPIIALGGLWLISWRGRLRWIGLGAAIIAFWLWGQASRPGLLIADTGSLLGLMTEAGRALSKPTGDSFAAESWLENDGAPVPQDEAALRDGFTHVGRTVSVSLGDSSVLLVTGKTALATLDGCAGADILISNQMDVGQRPCDVYDLRRLRQTGALALDAGPDGPIVTTSRGLSGERLWNGGADPIVWPY